MKNKPKCTLCSETLVLEKKVGIHVQAAWFLAGVCTNCSAAFPVAIGEGGLVRPPTPLYVDGKRTV
jgi:hypothetical protein